MFRKVISKRPFALRIRMNSTESSTNGTNSTNGKEEAVKEASLVEKLKEKDDQIMQLQDAYRRALADAENVRTRTKKELDEKSVFAIQKFAQDLIGTADVLSMALESVPKPALENDHVKNLFDGVELTRSELMKTFKRFGVEPFEALGQKFDPHLHQALFQAPIPDKVPGTVFNVTKQGYKLHDRVLRPAQVGVVKESD